MFTSEYDLAMDDEPDCEDCGRRLRWVVCTHCGGNNIAYKTWGSNQGRVVCQHCSHGGQYVCSHCDKAPAVETGQLGLFDVPSAARPATEVQS